MIDKILIAAAITSIAAVCRLETVRLFNHYSFPVATIMINVLGGFLLGLVNHWIVDSTWLLLIASAFISGYTTFSTFMNETVQLNLAAVWQSILYFVLTVGLGLGFAWLGNWI
ncbi:hypothetical protein WR164_02740 [Philodulcilactobacillus myokoensis]|uniref:Fluoride-specific ion channel n=1 Tax=Philodulcilactobacillus myokoensis TaxID=2929573 RepID=A0A9W6ERV9_9LACO|nr:CrcB family protein [Philodulcilactobacillus myokoensis]GLB46295.1 hypothetical protein WR164_02740 [Philodulcilactobacillus myokoensis]